MKKKKTIQIYLYEALLKSIRCRHLIHTFTIRNNNVCLFMVVMDTNIVVNFSKVILWLD